MRWSKLRSLVKSQFAESVRERIDIQSTRYGDCGCGRAWITVDGEVVANFCTRSNAIARYVADHAKAGFTPPGQFVAFGELSRQDAYQACWAFIHDLPIEASLSDGDPLVQSLAVLDHRVGKRRLSTLLPEDFHPLSGALLTVRKQAEGL